jgi:hypothetical protein
VKKKVAKRKRSLDSDTPGAHRGAGLHFYDSRPALDKRARPIIDRPVHFMSAHPDHPSLVAAAPREASILGDIAGGFSAALVALPQALAMGTLVFMPLGADKIHLGIAAGFMCSVAGGLVGVSKYPGRGRPRP